MQPEQAAGEWHCRAMSDPMLVVSSTVPGLRYVGFMRDEDFLVFFAHIAQSCNGHRTQLYRNLCCRLVPGWQIWKFGFTDALGERSHDCLTFRGARDFLKALHDAGLGPEDRARLALVQTAFAGDMPEGTFYPLPRAYPHDLHSLRVPTHPLRALCLERHFFPVLSDNGHRFLNLDMLARWYHLEPKSLFHFTFRENARVFGTQQRSLGDIDSRKQLYVPLSRAADCLTGLCSFWHTLGYPCWQPASLLATSLQHYLQPQAAPTASPDRAAVAPQAPSAELVSACGQDKETPAVSTASEMSESSGQGPSPALPDASSRPASGCGHAPVAAAKPVAAATGAEAGAAQTEQAASPAAAGPQPHARADQPAQGGDTSAQTQDMAPGQAAAASVETAPQPSAGQAPVLTFWKAPESFSEQPSGQPSRQPSRHSLPVRAARDSSLASAAQVPVQTRCRIPLSHQLGELFERVHLLEQRVGALQTCVDVLAQNAALHRQATASCHGLCCNLPGQGLTAQQLAQYLLAAPLVGTTVLSVHPNHPVGDTSQEADPDLAAEEADEESDEFSDDLAPGCSPMSMFARG